MPLTGIDDAWQTRIPQGWQQFADGTIGPPNQVGSDWNAAYRGAPGGAAIPDWLRQLIPSPGASVPNAPSLPGGGVGPRGAYMPGSGVMGLPAATPGAPSMGFPAQGGPPTIDPSQFQGGGMPGFLGGGNINPYARAAIAAAGIMQPTPTANDQAPTNAWFQRPSGVGGTPGPQVTNPMTQPGADGINPYAAAAAANPPQGGPYVGSGAPAPDFRGPPSRPYTPTPNPGPMDPSIIAHMNAAPQGTPSDTPRPGGSPRPQKNLGMGQSPTASVPPTSTGNPRFGLYQPQVPGSGQGGPLSRSPIYTTLNLFGGGQSAAAANPANVPAPAATPVSGRLPGGRYINPQPPGGPPDYGMSPVDITGYPVRGVNAPMFAALRGKTIPNPGGWYGS
jgi:hypothetical protein